MFEFFKVIFSPIGKVLKFISEHFKGMLFVLIVILIFQANSKDSIEKANLVSIDITGAITDSRAIIEKLEKARKNKNIKGVLLYVDSPGGALAPSVELSLAVRNLVQVKPVVSYAAGTMASGSYYASIWSNKIYANPGAFIGSIGVIFQSVNLEELLEKIGIKEQIIQAGKYKAAGTITRAWKDYEKEALTTLINDAYNLFVKDVSEARDLDINKSEEFANANVFIASKAKKIGLIDEVGSYTKATNFLVRISGVKEAIWEKPDKFEQLMQRLEETSTKIFLKNFFGLKAL